MKYKVLLIAFIMMISLSAGCQQAPPVPEDAVPETSGFAEPSEETPAERPSESDDEEKPVKPEYKKTVKTDKTYSFEQMVKDAEELAGLYPELIEKNSIGKSVEGRELTLLKLGKGEKNIFLCGAHHARGYITSTFLMKMADEYVYAYMKGGKFEGRDVKKLLDAYTVYIVPMVNPDGVNLVQNGPESVKEKAALSRIKMLKKSYSEWKANIRGVDLNRQYHIFWEEKDDDTGGPSSEMYKGTAPATEPEVKAVMQLCREVSLALAVSFHTKGEIIYWADSGTVDEMPAAQGMTEALSEATGYEIQPVSQDPAVYGAGFENWFRAEFERPGFCVELTPPNGSSQPHDDAQFDELVWSKTKDLVIRLMEKA